MSSFRHPENGISSPLLIFLSGHAFTNRRIWAISSLLHSPVIAELQTTQSAETWAILRQKILTLRVAAMISFKQWLLYKILISSAMNSWSVVVFKVFRKTHRNCWTPGSLYRAAKQQGEQQFVVLLWEILLHISKLSVSISVIAHG